MQTRHSPKRRRALKPVRHVPGASFGSQHCRLPCMWPWASDPSRKHGGSNNGAYLTGRLRAVTHQQAWLGRGRAPPLRRGSFPRSTGQAVATWPAVARKDGFAQTEDLGPSASPKAPRKLRLPATGAFSAWQHAGRLARAFKVTSEHQLPGSQIDRRNITLFP